MESAGIAMRGREGRRQRRVRSPVRQSVQVGRLVAQRERRVYPLHRQTLQSIFDETKAPVSSHRTQVSA